MQRQSGVEIESHGLIARKKLTRSFLVVLVDMDVCEIQSDRTEGQVDHSSHEIEVVDVGRESKVSVAATLVGRKDKFPLVYLELHEAQARCLVRLGSGRAKEQHVILAAPSLPVDLCDQRW